MKADERNQQLKRSRYWLAGLIGVVIGVGLTLIQQGATKILPTNSNRDGLKPNGLIQTEIESPYGGDQASVETRTDGKRQKLTASELFDLRTKCASCAKKVLQDNYPDWMPGIMFRLSNSRYDPKSGRCFVELKVGNIPKDPSIEPTNYHQLFDGQTGQELAETKIYRGGTPTGGALHRKESIYY